MKPIPPTALGGTVAVLLVAAVATVLVTGRGPDHLPTGSPEAAVQEYLEAVRAEDHVAALTHLTPASGCTEDDLVVAMVDDDLHVTLLDTEVTARRARVRVEVTNGAGGLFPGGWTEEQEYRLVRDGGQWLLQAPAWPLHDCGAGFK